jgi:integrase/recombinase XerD
MHLIEAGVNLIYIRDLLGHANVSTTEIYAKARVLHQAGEKPQVARSRRRRNSASNLRSAAA